MGWIAAAIGIGIGKTVAGIFGSNAQRKVDKRQTQLQYEDNLEKIRRREFDQAQTQGQANLTTEASGVRHTGGSTAQGFLDVMAGEFRKELDWMSQYAERSRALGMKRANVAHTTGIFNAISGGIGTGLNVYGARG